jgi:tRNA pseudouridine55 synthase
LNRLFVINKPIFISSNFYLRKIKRKYKTKKAGFSGTLDPFATGCLIVAFGQYTKLFQFLKKTPKTYRTTIWLGATSSSLDIENINVPNIMHKKIDQSIIKQELDNLVGELTYLPPKYSAKKIDGKRAYNLARDGEDFTMKQITSTVFNVNFINYCHPFITFDISVSEGSYIRSIAQILLDRLDSTGTLSFLDRLNEGKFKIDNEKALNPLEYLDLEENIYTGTKEWVELGKKLQIEFFENKSNGNYLLTFDTFFAVIKIEDEKITYLLNKVMLNDS